MIPQSIAAGGANDMGEVSGGQTVERPVMFLDEMECTLCDVLKAFLLPVTDTTNPSHDLVMV